MKNIILGAHCFVKGGPASAIESADLLKMNTVQLFSKNSNRWEASPYTNAQITEFKNKLMLSQIKDVFVHASYLINLATPNEILLHKSINAFKDELFRCFQLGIKYLVIHPGSHKEISEEEGLNNVVKSINKAYSDLNDINVVTLLETTAGQGSCLGKTFNQLQYIISRINDKNKIGVCLDTAHIFEAGYEIRTISSYNQTIRDFDDTIGLNKLKCIHINDSKTDFNSHVDRHEHIGKGKIGIEAFSFIMNDEKLNHIPKILETPKQNDQAEDVENMNVLRGLVRV